MILTLAGRRFDATILTATLLVLLVTPPAQAQDALAAFDVKIDTGTVDARGGPDVNITDTSATIEGVALTISARAPAIGEVNVSSQFNVTRARQVVPRLGGAIMEERTAEEIESAAGPAFNLSSGEDWVRFTILVPAGDHDLTLTPDTTPPGWQMSAPSDVTHNAAVITSRTDEAALAILLLENPRVGTVAFSTPAPGGRQTFPLSGLEPETNYSFTITFEDFSGNTVTSESSTFRTTARPILPQPRVSIITPANGSTVAQPVTRIDARIEDVASPVRAVSLYVDKTFVPDATRLLSGSEFRYLPLQALGPGRHTVVLEATNEVGGEARSIATFTVAANNVPFHGGGVVAAILVASAIIRARRAPEAEAGPTRRP